MGCDDRGRSNWRRGEELERKQEAVEPQRRELSCPGTPGMVARCWLAGGYLYPADSSAMFQPVSGPEVGHGEANLHVPRPKWCCDEHPASPPVPAGSCVRERETV